MSLRYGSLCAGYGGLDMGVMRVLPGELAWYAEFDPAPSRVMAAHHPGVPNLGDMTAIDWSTVPPVDVLTGGTPCQDLSHAGKRKGMTDGTRSNLWVQMREAIAVLRPRLVVWENVRGALSAPADSALEPCPGCVGDLDDGPVLRALGRVLGDLADLGYDARWYCLRAADVGAAHGRFRVFLFAVPADSARDPWWLGYGDGGAARDADCVDSQGRGASGLAGQARPSAGHHETLALLPTPDAYAADRGGSQHPEKRAEGGHSISLGDVVEHLLPTPRVSMGNGPSQRELEEGNPNSRIETAVALLPTPRATDGTKGGPNQRGSSGDLMLPSAVHLLPTPAVNDMGEGKTVEAWDEWTARMKATHGNGNGHGASLAIEAQRMLPTPRASLPDARVSQRARDLYSSGDMLGDIVAENKWEQYAAAIARHERAIGRPMPDPTEPGPKGGRRLSPRFVEALMMLPDGVVTGRGLTRTEELRVLGNGVVPPQAEAATRAWAADMRAEVAA